MASVTINQGMPAPEESAFEVSRDRWQLLAMARRQWAEIELPFDCRLLKLVQDEAPILAEAMGYESGDQFLTDYLSLDMELVRRVVGWLEREKPADAVGLNDANYLALKAESYAQQMLSLDQPTFASSGDNQYTLSAERGPDIIRANASEGGTSAGYLAARLKKAGRNDLLEQIGPGKPYRSVRSAAIEAGIIKPVPTVRLTDPEQVAAKLRQHWDDEQITALCEALLR